MVGRSVTDVFDTSGKWTSKCEFTPHDVDPEIFLQITGTYSLSGDKLTRTGKDVKVIGATPDQQARFLKEKGKEYTATRTDRLQWKSEDELYIGKLGQAEVLTRQKD